MRGLLTKDFLVIAKQLKLFLIIIPIMAIIGGSSIASVAILLGAVLPMTALAYDEQSKWSEISAMLPYSKRDMVLSKYLLGYLCIAGITLLFVVTQLVVQTAGHGNITASLSMLFFSVLSALFFTAINIPIMLKFGTQKGRFVFIVFIGLAAAAATILKELRMESSFASVEYLPLILFLIAVILNAISMIISLRMMK